MGKTPGKWIKTLLLGKKSPKSNLAVSSVKDDLSNLSLHPPVASSSQPDAAQNEVASSNGGVVEPRKDVDELKLERAASKIQAVFRARQARRAIRTLKGIIRLQAVIRGHLVRRQAVATYSCVWGIVKLQALVRGRIARSSSSSSHNVIQCHKPNVDVNDSEALQVSMYSWMDNPTKFIIVNKLLASSPTALPLKIQYGPGDPNSAEVWLERWTQMHVWSPPPRAAKILVPKPKNKKRSYEAVVDSEKARPKQGVKKQSGPTSGKGSNRSTTESEKPKRSVRKASTVSKDPLRTESDKAKQKSRKSRSASKEEVKEEKPRPSLKRSSLSNTSMKGTRKSAEKKKDTVDSVQIEPEVKVSDVLEVGDDVESAEKEKDTADSAQIEPEVKVLDVLEGGGDAVESAEKEKDTADSTQIEPEVKVSGVLEGGDAVESTEKEKEIADNVQIEPEMKVSDDLQGGAHGVESAEKEKDTTDAVPTELDVEENEKSPEEDELRTSETNDKGEDLKCSDAKVSSENGYTASDNSKPSEKRVSSLHANDEGRTHSGRKTPSYMAPTASTLRRHSLPSPANGKPGTTTTTTTMSPRAHKLPKGSMNGDKSASSLKNKSEKSNKTDWKR